MKKIIQLILLLIASAHYLNAQIGSNQNVDVVKTTENFNTAIIISLPPMLICADDSAKVGNTWLKCADAKAGMQSLTITSPSGIDTTYQFILQCIKINPVVVPTEAFIDCKNKTPTINAGGTIFSPVSTQNNPGIKKYTWNTGETTPSITVNNTGKYYVTIEYNYTLNTALGSVTKTCSKVRSVSVEGGIEPVPAPTIYLLSSTNTEGGVSKFTSEKDTTRTYKWEVQGGTPSSYLGDTLTVNWGNTPPFKVCLSYTNFCTESFDTCSTIQLGMVGVGDINNNDIAFDVLPNPATSQLTVLLPSQKGRKTILVYDIFGNLLKEENIESDEKRSDIDISFLPNGMYLVSLKTANGNVLGVKKVIKL